MIATRLLVVRGCDGISSLVYIGNAGHADCEWMTGDTEVGLVEFRNRQLSPCYLGYLNAVPISGSLFDIRNTYQGAAQLDTFSRERWSPLFIRTSLAEIIADCADATNDARTSRRSPYQADNKPS